MKLAIFASGSGSNAAALMQHFSSHEHIQLGLVVTNKPEAGVITHAKSNKIPVLVVDKQEYTDARFMLEALEGIAVIVLAGFLKLIPEWLVNAYPDRILNIHPALLPKFGGKGMYGMHIHEAVCAAGERETGLTIHLVNREYDKGAQLFQMKCPVLPNDTPHDVATRVLKLEHEFYPKVVEKYVLQLNRK
jgi:phosphoribosylglycinamide formyltransferase-1